MIINYFLEYATKWKKDLEIL